MKKVILMVDTTTAGGFMKPEIEKKGLIFVPIVVTVDGVEYKAGDEINNGWLAKNVNIKSVVKTSQVNPLEIENGFKRGLESAEHVFYVPISTGLSSTYSTASAIAAKPEFKGKVTIYDSHYITPWIQVIFQDLIDVVNKANSTSEIEEFLNYWNGKMFGWIAPQNLDRLYAGGRISKVQYIAGKLLKVTPVIPVFNGSMNEEGTVKGKGLEKTMDKVAKIAIAKSKELEAELGVEIALSYIDEFELGLKQILKDNGVTKMTKVELGPEIIAHIGSGSWGVGLMPRKK